MCERQKNVESLFSFKCFEVKFWEGFIIIWMLEFFSPRCSREAKRGLETFPVGFFLPPRALFVCFYLRGAWRNVAQIDSSAII